LLSVFLLVEARIQTAGAAFFPNHELLEEPLPSFQSDIFEKDNDLLLGIISFPPDDKDDI
jgi:hypothetical protein